MLNPYLLQWIYEAIYHLFKFSNSNLICYIMEIELYYLPGVPEFLFHLLYLYHPKIKHRTMIIIIIRS